MTIDFQELHDRVDYCETQIKDFQQSLIDFKNGNISFEFEPQSDGTHHMFGRLLNHIPGRFRSQSGMIANELRSTLDSLAAFCAEQNAGNSTQTYFPISKSKEIFENDGERKMKKLSGDHKDIIRSLSPYQEGNPLLYHLHIVDVQRKHIRLNPSSLLPSVSPPLVNIGPGGKGQFTHCFFPGGFAENLTVYGPNDSDFKQLNRPVLLATGVPQAFPLKLMANAYFNAPEPVKSRDISASLQRWAGLVREIIGKFE